MWSFVKAAAGDWEPAHRDMDTWAITLQRGVDTLEEKWGIKGSEWDKNFQFLPHSFGRLAVLGKRSNIVAIAEFHVVEL